MASARFIVHGHVQGVFFRASTREQALKLGVSGYAKNLPDGSVEVLACGPAAALDGLQQWLRRGPPSARVEDIVREAMPDQTMQGFSTR